LNRVDFPTLGRPTMAMRGSEACKKWFSLSFRKITHQMMWDLYCLSLIYSRMQRTDSHF
jgi:hypothetical protein